MKKVLFFLLWANVCVAQTDSVNTAGKDSLIQVITVSNSTYSTDFRVKRFDEVTVYATRARSSTPTTFQTISKEELNRNNLGQDLPFLLDQTPNAVTTSDAGAGIGYTGLRIRGSDNTRINVTMNGIPVNDAESQGMFWVDIPDVASSAQSIQIQRGIGSSTNGGSAFGGSISLQTQSPSVKPFVEANVSGGSFNTFKINGKLGTGIHKGFFFEGSGSLITSDGYIDRASSNLVSWFSQIGYLKDNTLIKLVYFAGQERTYQSWNGVPQDSLSTNRRFNDLGTDYGQHLPAYKNQVDNYNQDYFQLLFAQNFSKNINLNAGLFTTLGHGYYEEYKVGQTFNDYFANHDTLGIATDLVRQKWLKNIFCGGSFALSFENKKISATLGGLLGQYRGQNFGNVIWAQDVTDFDKSARYYDGSSIKNDFNVYGKFNYQLLYKVNFYVDLQYRYIGHTANGVNASQMPFNFANKWHFFNPKAGILYHIKSNHDVYVSYAMGHREPNRDDVLAAQADNKMVKPETMHNVEVGYKFQHGNFPLAINYYLMQYKDQLVLTGKLSDVGSALKENVAVSYRTGVELSGSVKFRTSKVGKTGNAHDVIWKPNADGSTTPQRIVFSINYAFAYSINKIKSFDEYIYTYDDYYTPVDSLTQVITHKNTNISFSPNVVASLELVGYPVEGLEIALMNKAVSKQYLDNTSNENRKIKPFFYSNLRISYKLPLKRDDKEIKFTLLMNNIFNRLYVSNGYSYSERYYSGGATTDTYTYNYYYPQAGFNVLGGISVRF